MTIATMPATYLSCAETAKIIRQTLKVKFPGVTFGVRSHTYSGMARAAIAKAEGE